MNIPNCDCWYADVSVEGFWRRTKGHLEFWNFSWVYCPYCKIKASTPRQIKDLVGLLEAEHATETKGPTADQLLGQVHYAHEHNEIHGVDYTNLMETIKSHLVRKEEANE